MIEDLKKIACLTISKKLAQPGKYFHKRRINYLIAKPDPDEG